MVAVLKNSEKLFLYSRHIVSPLESLKIDENMIHDFYGDHLSMSNLILSNGPQHSVEVASNPISYLAVLY